MANDITEPELTAGDFEPGVWTHDAIIRKLTRASTVLSRVNGRLTDIREHASPPPDPVKPQALAAAQRVIDNATQALALANEIKGKLR
jgi:hypothetical protein